MSVFRPYTVNCPSCGSGFVFDVCKSVNADRRPDLRAAIVAGDFQVERCPTCDAVLRLPPELTYVDVAHHLWALVQPAEKLERWSDLERQAVELYDQSYGAEAPQLVQEIGRSLSARITFGWGALREKLAIADLGLDDVTVELVKLMLVRSMESPLSDDVELRLQEADAATDELVFAWVRAADEALVEVVRVPRGLYAQIESDPAWAELRQEVSAGPFVDIHRLLVPQDEEEPAAEGAA